MNPDEEIRRAYDGLGWAFEQMFADQATIWAAYEAMPKEWRRAVLLVEYRCTNRGGCLLLHAWQGQNARAFFYVPSYKMSRERNARESEESARLKNTLDGDRIWRPRAGMLDDLAEWGNEIGIALECDHLLPVTKTPAEILADTVRATPGKPTRRFIAARYA